MLHTQIGSKELLDPIEADLIWLNFSRAPAYVLPTDLKPDEYIRQPNPDTKQEWPDALIWHKD